MILSSSSSRDETLSTSVASPEVSLVDVGSCQLSILRGPLAPALHVPGTLRIRVFLSCGCRLSTSIISRLSSSVFHKWCICLFESASGIALHKLVEVLSLSGGPGFFRFPNSAFWCHSPSSIFAPPLPWDLHRLSVFASHLSLAFSVQPHFPFFSRVQICRSPPGRIRSGALRRSPSTSRQGRAPVLPAALLSWDPLPSPNCS